MIEAHLRADLIMDFAMGPNQGQGVPALEDDEGLEWELAPFNVSIPIGTSFNDTIPGWGTGILQAVVTGLVTDSVVTNLTFPTLPGGIVANRTQKTLAESSLQEMTEHVKEDGSLAISCPQSSEGLEYTIFAYYLVQDHHRNQATPTTLSGPQTKPETFVQNGSWTVDHFSPRGAKVMTDFWDNYLLLNGTKEALQKVGNYAWEDSVEITPLLYWTKYLPQRFQQARGYSINKYIPLLFHQSTHKSRPIPPVWYVTDERDAGNSHIADYRTTVRSPNKIS